jgi:hypothetical protein
VDVAIEIPLLLNCLRRFNRIQEEAGIKSKKQKGADDLAGDAAAALSKSGGMANLLDELLEGDFDPDAYDKRMAAAFNDDYYEVRAVCSIGLISSSNVCRCVFQRVHAGLSCNLALQLCARSRFSLLEITGCCWKCGGSLLASSKQRGDKQMRGEQGGD